VTVEALIDEIVVRLTAAGYQALGRRVRIGSIAYEFAAVLLGPEGTLDLVIVVNSNSVDEVDRLHQRIEGVGRALDMAGSRRTVTSIVVGSTPDESVLSAIRRVGRYLLIQDQPESQPEWLEDRLAILLPLNLGIATEGVPEPVDELLRRLDLSEDDERRALVSAVSKGSSEVEAQLKRFIEAPLKAGK